MTERTNVAESDKIIHYTAKLEATRRELEVVKTSFFKAKSASRKISWPNKPPTERMRVLLKIVSFAENSLSKARLPFNVI